MRCLNTSRPPHTPHNRFMALSGTTQGEPVPEENFWTLWCKGKLTEADTPTVRLGATPSGLTSAHLHHPPHFFTGRMPFLPPNQQCQSTEGNVLILVDLLLEIMSVHPSARRYLHPQKVFPISFRSNLVCG